MAILTRFSLILICTLAILLTACAQTGSGGSTVPAPTPPSQAESTAATPMTPTTSTNEEAAMPSTGNFEIQYNASGGQPPVAMTLHIAPDGQADLYLGSSWSVPQGGSDKVGFFGGPVDAAAWAGLNTYLTDHNFLTRAGGAASTSPGQTTRSLTLKQGGQETTLVIGDTSSDSVLASVATMLDDILVALTGQPIRAAQVDFSVAPVADGLEPTLTITHLGSEPLPVLFFDPADTNQYLRVELAFESVITLPSGLTMRQPLGGVKVPREAIVALVDAGTIPGGVSDMSAGQSYQLVLDPVAKPQGQNVALNATLTFWLPGDGAERRVVYIQPPRLMVE
jgi:hypothetical protein